MKKDGKYFWRGIKHEIPLCCIIFFENSWDSIRCVIPNYGNSMHKLTDNAGVILCPDCIEKKISSNC